MIAIQAMIGALDSICSSLVAACQAVFAPDPDTLGLEAQMDHFGGPREEDWQQDAHYLALVPWWM